MYQGKNPSALRSREEIVEAFLSMLQEMPWDQITVKQLMNATQLTRQTFYQIFSSKEEILEFYLDTLFASFLEEVETKEIQNLCDAGHVFFTFFEKYEEILALIIENGKSCVLQRKCRAFLREENYLNYPFLGANTEAERDYTTTFVISGMVAMLEQWIRERKEGAEGAKLQPIELANLVCRLTGTE